MPNSDVDWFSRDVAANSQTGTESQNTGTGSQNSQAGKSVTSAKPEKNSVLPKHVEVRKDQPLKPHSANPRATIVDRVPTVYLTPEAYRRICAIVDIAPLEVGWLGSVRILPNGDFLIENVFLVKQSVTATETELSVDGVSDLVVELLKQGESGLAQVNKLHFWGHSHVRMGTYPSGTDERTMERFCAEGHEFYIRGIVNKLGDGKFDIYYCRVGLRLLDVPWSVRDEQTGAILLSHRRHESLWTSFFGTKTEDTPCPLPEQLKVSEELRSAIEAEYKLKVTERKPMFSLPSWNKQTPFPIDFLPDKEIYKNKPKSSRMFGSFGNWLGDLISAPIRPVRRKSADKDQK